MFHRQVHPSEQENSGIAAGTQPSHVTLPDPRQVPFAGPPPILAISSPCSGHALPERAAAEQHLDAIAALLARVVARDGCNLPETPVGSGTSNEGSPTSGTMSHAGTRFPGDRG